MKPTPSETAGDQPDDQSAVSEHRYHSYDGTRIPWWVRVMWTGFWCIAVFYIVRYLFPMLQTEISNPP